MAYPDWVLKHKKKGTYINKVGEKYYLYAAHSEHIPGTANSSRRICDGYLGRITEKDGFIPSKKKALPSPILLEGGLSCAILSICEVTFQRIIKDHPNHYKIIIIQALLDVIYGEASPDLSYHSYLHRFLPMIKSLDENIGFQIARTKNMIQSILLKNLKSSEELARFQFEMYAIKILISKEGESWSAVNEVSQLYIDKFHICLEDNILWKQLKKQ